MSVVILSSSSFKDLLLLFDLKVFDLFFVEALSLFNKRREEKKTLFVKNSFFDFLFVLRSFRFLRHVEEVKSQPLLSLLWVSLS